ncbi:MAG: tyrosine-type recombinase/integrase [Ruminiclostridium sp.]|nr:tyrosine-type recombinase/integrase [Ruminiclostridium sp.]
MAMIEERKNKDGRITSYRFIVSLGYDVHGKQIFKKKSWKPLPGMTKIQIRKELEKESAKFESECLQGLCVNDDITFQQLYDMWWNEYATINLKKSTLESYEKMKPAIMNAIGHIKLSKFQPHHLNEFYASLMGRDIKCNEAVLPKIDFTQLLLVHNGKKCTKKRMKQIDLSKKAGVSLTTIKTMLDGNPISVKCAKAICEAMELNFGQTFEKVKRKALSSATAKRYHGLISAVFTHAVYQNIIPINPCTRVRPPKKSSEEAQYLDEDQMHRMLNLLEDAKEPFRTMTMLCMFLGLRRGELCALEWDNINFDRRIISVRKNLIASKMGGVFEDTPKNRTSIREIRVSDSIIDMLREYKAWQDDYRENVGSLWEDTGKLFTNATGGWLNPSTYSGWFSKFCNKNGFANVHVHTLRHTSATIMLMNGVPLRVVSQRLGHHDSSTTNNIYAHVIRRADEYAAEALDKALFTDGDAS